MPRSPPLASPLRGRVARTNRRAGREVSQPGDARQDESRRTVGKWHNDRDSRDCSRRLEGYRAAFDGANLDFNCSRSSLPIRQLAFHSFHCLETIVQLIFADPPFYWRVPPTRGALDFTAPLTSWYNRQKSSRRSRRPHVQSISLRRQPSNRDSNAGMPRCLRRCRGSPARTSWREHSHAAHPPSSSRHSIASRSAVPQTHGHGSLLPRVGREGEEAEDRREGRSIADQTAASG
jgi:hypothetical protein